MSYTSFIYLCLLLLLVPLYYLTPRKVRWVILLGGNILFYIAAGLQELCLLLISALISYAGARIIAGTGEKMNALKGQDIPLPEKKAAKKKLKNIKKRQLQAVLVLLIGILGVTKYTNFSISLFGKIFGLSGIPVLKLIVPMGVSFYTFQMVAYVMDVYKSKIRAQENFAKYFLYSSFFPTIVQGPIGRYKNLAAQLYEGNSWHFSNVRDGAILILWGFAKKLVIADRLNMFTRAIFDNYTEYHGQIFLVAAIVYSIQTYADFAGCMDIGMGSARLFGIHVERNFLRPYFSQNLPEFWRRWHVTMGAWFRDYVFFPFSISRVSQKLNKFARTHFGERAGKIAAASLPILLVWTLTGLWHGASLNYIAWGLFHGTLIMLSTILGPWIAETTKKLHIRTDNFSFKLFRIARTFLLCSLGRVFFRAGSIHAALLIMKNIFTEAGFWRLMPQYMNSAYGLTAGDFKIVFVFLLAWLIVSLLQERGVDVLQAFGKQNLIFRWTLLYVLFFFVVICGVYGAEVDASSFIYEQF